MGQIDRVKIRDCLGAFGTVGSYACVMELTYIGCVERTGVLGGGGAVVAHGSSGIVTLTCAYHPSVYHMLFLIMAAGESEYH